MIGPNELDDPNMDAESETRTWIAEHRLRCGLTIAGLARRAGLSRTTIHLLERDECFVPSGHTLTRLATALGVQIPQLFAPPNKELTR